MKLQLNLLVLGVSFLISLNSSAAQPYASDLCTKMIPEPATQTLVPVTHCSLVVDPGMGPGNDGAETFVEKMEACLLKGTTALGDTYFIFAARMNRLSDTGMEKDVNLQYRFKSWNPEDRLFEGKTTLHLTQATIGTDESSHFERAVAFDSSDNTLQFLERGRFWGYVTDFRWRTLVNVKLVCGN